MGAEGDALFADFAQFIEAENLKTAGIGKDGARPGHETVQPAQLAYLLHSGPQIQVVGVAEQNLHAKFFENVLRNAFDGSQRADRHEDRSFDLAVGSQQASEPGVAGGSVNLELEGHDGIVAISRQQPA